MSRAIDRHRARKESIYGDAGGGGDAKGWGDLVATLAQAGAEIADTQMKKEAAAKKASADKEADLKKQNEIKDAELAADAKRQTATQKAQAAQIAAVKAQAEKESYGPLHVAALNAKNEADLADGEARKAEAKLATLKAGVAGSPEATAQLQKLQKEIKGGSKVPTWAWVAGGVVGASGLGYLIYRLARRRK